MHSRGVLYVHSAPLAVVPHVEWAVSRVLGSPVRLRWSTQPVDGSRRMECNWSGRPGTAAEFVSALRRIGCPPTASPTRWPMLRFEVTEEPSPGYDGERYMYVPGRGVFRAAMNVTGDLMIIEDQVRSVLARAGASQRTPAPRITPPGLAGPPAQPKAATEERMAVPTVAAYASSAETIVDALDRLLGTAWDAELEPYRHAGDGAPATRLTQVS